jgi:hypothetical protein
LPDDLVLAVQEETGFGTGLFYNVWLTAGPEQETRIHFLCDEPNKYWEHRFGLSTLLKYIADQVAFHDGWEVEDVDVSEDWKQLYLAASLPDHDTFGASIGAAAQEVVAMIREAELALGGMAWRSEYEQDESLFCTDILGPLLRRMGFLSVRYTHGTKEFGRDFTFAEATRFGNFRHFGLQAKAGNISGGANSAVDELVGQVADAFALPFYGVGSGDAHYISELVIAISGRFTENAKEKIVAKVSPSLLGSIYFLDRESILELVERHWVAKTLGS